MTQEIITNIDYDASILNEEIHATNLKIANLNLADFNKRLNTNIRLKYFDSRHKFYIIWDTENIYNLHLFEDYCYINWFLIINNNNDLKEEWISRLYVERLNNHFHHSKFPNDKYEVAMFLKLFENYCPLGFLTPKEEVELKGNINQLCKMISGYL